jgi:hypothetical protein
VFERLSYISFAIPIWGRIDHGIQETFLAKLDPSDVQELVLEVVGLQLSR